MEASKVEKEAETKEEENRPKKRAAEKQSRKEDLDREEDEIQEEDTGVFAKASEKEISQRRMVKVRRIGSQPVPETNQKPTTPTTTSTPTPTFQFGTTAPITASPFNFTFTPVAANGKSDEKKEDKKEEKKKEGTTPTSAQPLGAFNWNFTPKEGDKSSSTNVPLFSPTFNFTFTPPTAGASIFGLNIAPPKPSEESEVPELDIQPPEPEPAVKPDLRNVKTGEEDEVHLFQTRVKLFVLKTKEEIAKEQEALRIPEDKIERKEEPEDQEEKKEQKTENKEEEKKKEKEGRTVNPWRERGVGMLRLNKATDNSSSRLLMRVEGSLKLILNMKLFSQIKPEKAGDKQVRFIGPDLQGNEIRTFLVRVPKPEIAAELIQVIEKNKDTGSKQSEPTDD